MPYTSLDHFIAIQRFKAAYPHIRQDSRVCDLGCGLHTAFLDFAAARITTGVGVDDQVESRQEGRWQRVHADIRAPLPLESGQFDHVVMLAVLEHLPQPEPVLREAHRLLAPGGSLILTWPSALVDPLLYILHRLRFVSDEMESDEHQQRIPPATLRLALQRIGFTSFLHRHFELGLNNLMVASRS